MNWGEAGRAGFREIRANKFRSVLSFLAVSVGVASLLYTLAQTRGMSESLKKTLDLMGPGRLTIEKKRGYVSKGLSKGLVVEDASAIERELPELFMVYPSVRRWGSRLVYGPSKIDDFAVDGVTPSWRKRDFVYKLRGRFLNEQDVAQAARVCVVVEPGGWEEKPFWASYWNWESPFDGFIARRDLVGRRVILDDHVFTVVGALKSPPKDKDPRWFSWNDPQMLVPVTTYHRFLAEGDQKAAPTAVDEIKLDTGSEATIAAAKGRIAALLKQRHRGEEDFEIKDMRDEIESEMSDSKQTLIAAIALGVVALLAGGIGIMNVTLAAIFSRVKEIGIRRAVGAAKADIMAQFILEAVFLGLAGGLAGIGLGAAGINYLAKQASHNISSIAWYHFPAALAVAALVSGLSAFYPAWQAANLDPVEALRSE